MTLVDRHRGSIAEQRFNGHERAAPKGRPPDVCLTSWVSRPRLLPRRLRRRTRRRRHLRRHLRRRHLRRRRTRPPRPRPRPRPRPGPRRRPRPRPRRRSLHPTRCHLRRRTRPLLLVVRLLVVFVLVVGLVLTLVVLVGVFVLVGVLIRFVGFLGVIVRVFIGLVVRVLVGRAGEPDVAHRGRPLPLWSCGTRDGLRDCALAERSANRQREQSEDRHKRGEGVQEASRGSARHDIRSRFILNLLLDPSMSARGSCAGRLGTGSG